MRTEIQQGQKQFPRKGKHRIPELGETLLIWLNSVALTQERIATSFNCAGYGKRTVHQPSI
ncbi:hypothetical protein E2C01_053180 [Portunus trituberculatus]|uniref:Uncharacterized protein n=1 Tax=Portunus trituberculatus TaxID=210409 RepID=A0A5B7GNT9_PORTR|nr:hypothetical protein [Portunus trituberculatus]